MREAGATELGRRSRRRPSLTASRASPQGPCQNHQRPLRPTGTQKKRDGVEQTYGYLICHLLQGACLPNKYFVKEPVNASSCFELQLVKFGVASFLFLLNTLCAFVASWLEQAPLRCILKLLKRTVFVEPSTGPPSTSHAETV